MARPRYLSRLGLGGTSAESTAAGIYGVIVSSAVMAASHAATAAAATVAVLVTLAIYWGAERYARIVAERIHAGRRPDRRELRHQLTTGWEMITASFLPLAVLDISRVLGVQLSTALLAGLSCSTLLLGIAGWAVGREGKLSTWERLVSATVAAAFGGVMIVLKMLLH
ncbi:MAG TPA: hypothetical protein VH573_22660 [Mycobacteriales bacterium]